MAKQKAQRSGPDPTAEDRARAARRREKRRLAQRQRREREALRMRAVRWIADLIERGQGG